MIYIDIERLSKKKNSHATESDMVFSLKPKQLFFLQKWT